MPRFNYQCEDCSEEFEYFIVRSDDHPSCPNCSSTNLQKQVSLFAVGRTNSNFHKAMDKVKKFSAEKEKPKPRKITGCARGYANKILANYK